MITRHIIIVRKGNKGDLLVTLIDGKRCFADGMKAVRLSIEI
jgi:hypothetical protein